LISAIWVAQEDERRLDSVSVEGVRGMFLALSGPPTFCRTRMNHKFDKKSKKSFKSSQRHISLGIPTNIAAGPLGFRAELDIGPKGE